MSDQKLDKNKILTTEARRVVFQSLMSGMRYKEAAQAAGLKHDTVKSLATKFHLAALVRQEKAEIERKTAEMLEETTKLSIDRFRVIHEQAMVKDDLTNASRAAENLARISGAFEADNNQKATKILLVLGAPKGME